MRLRGHVSDFKEGLNLKGLVLVPFNPFWLAGDFGDLGILLFFFILAFRHFGLLTFLAFLHVATDCNILQLLTTFNNCLRTLRLDKRWLYRHSDGHVDGVRCAHHPDKKSSYPIRGIVCCRPQVLTTKLRT